MMAVAVLPNSQCVDVIESNTTKEELVRFLKSSLWGNAVLNSS